MAKALKNYLYKTVSEKIKKNLTNKTKAHVECEHENKCFDIAQVEVVFNYGKLIKLLKERGK